MFKDYYKILGIPASTNKAEIKSAYKRQAIKWHPDKNHRVDTTEKMKEINEAHLILGDDEARSHYDIQYFRFKKFQQENKKEKQGAEHKTSKTERKISEEEYLNFQFDDELLKKWMKNARKQAIRNVQDMIIEFRESSILGFGTFVKTSLMAIVICCIYIIIQILISI